MGSALVDLHSKSTVAGKLLTIPWNWLTLGVGGQSLQSSKTSDVKTSEDRK